MTMYMNREILNTINMNTIPFNKPCILDDSLKYVSEVFQKGKLCGNGDFTKKCQTFFETGYGFKKCLMTSSCTDALEMAAILCNIRPGDEVIVPSYTFVSTALAFVRQGAKIVFADSETMTPNIDTSKIESLISPNTKAIVPVHYAGVACDMEQIMRIADKYGLWVVEDAAQAVDSFYNGRPLGSIGHLSAFSFHETKNITSGEGGLLVVNDDRLLTRAEIIWEKGTNRSQFFRGEVNKYGWVDTGSSFLPSELNAALLYSQLIHLKMIQDRRIALWNHYFRQLDDPALNEHIVLPYIPEYATNNAHMFYFTCRKADARTALLSYLKDHGVHATFHYLSLHNSDFAKNHGLGGQYLPQADFYTDNLVRLPLYFTLSEDEQTYVTSVVKEFFRR